MDRTGDGTVWLTVCALNRPAHWYSNAGGPATRGLEHAYARRCGATLRAAVRGIRGGLTRSGAIRRALSADSRGLSADSRGLRRADRRTNFWPCTNSWPRNRPNSPFRTGVLR